MGQRLPLPKYEHLPEGVYFHREHPTEPRITLQVPNADRTDSETYVLDLDSADHRLWLENLRNSKLLRDMLGWAQHVAYCPRTGHFQEMADLDERAPGEVLTARAHQEMVRDRTADVFFARRRQRHSVPGPSRLRQMLGGGRRV